MKKSGSKKVVQKKEDLGKDKKKPKKKIIKNESEDSDDIENQNDQNQEQIELPEEKDFDDSFGDANEVDDQDDGEKEEEEGGGDDDEVEEEEGEGEGEGEEKEEKEEKDGDDNKDKCIYNHVNDGDSEDDEEIVFDDDNIETKAEILSEDKRTTKPILYKYERVRLIGDRAQQLTLGAKPMIKNVQGLKPKEIAELEIRENVIPLIIQRPLPNGKKERWYIHELLH